MRSALGSGIAQADEKLVGSQEGGRDGWGGRQLSRKRRPPPGVLRNYRRVAYSFVGSGSYTGHAYQPKKETPMAPQPMPTNCNADDEAREVAFELDFEGARWSGSVSYDKLALMFVSPRSEASDADVRQSRIQLVAHSKAIARMVIERIRAGATKSDRIVIH